MVTLLLKIIFVKDKVKNFDVLPETVLLPDAFLEFFLIKPTNKTG
jgi:hypothetical protein